MAKRVEIGQRPRLRRHRFGQFLAAMAKVYTPQTCDRIEIGPAVAVAQASARALGDDLTSLGRERREIGIGVDEVIPGPAAMHLQSRLAT